jgi:hypothetical protein
MLSMKLGLRAIVSLSVSYMLLAQVTLLIFGEAHDEKNHPEPRHFVAVVIPSRSQDTWHEPQDASIVNSLLPSLSRSLSDQDIEHFSVEVLVVFDMGDEFWEANGIKKHIEQNVSLPVHFLSVAKSTRVPFNEGCRAAYELGADYIVRVNDDTQFTGKGWLSTAVEVLNDFVPAGMGVVGPTCKQGNTEILTHDMVHRTHLDIFDDYYPVEFENWYLDDWISHVYGESHTKKLLPEEWEVVHNTQIYGTRYTANETKAELLSGSLISSKQRIIDFLTMKKTAQERHLIQTNSRLVRFHSSSRKLPSSENVLLYR